jgi:hypothetical protein
MKEMNLNAGKLIFLLNKGNFFNTWVLGWVLGVNTWVWVWDLGLGFFSYLGISMNGDIPKDDSGKKMKLQHPLCSSTFNQSNKKKKA